MVYGGVVDWVLEAESETRLTSSVCGLARQVMLVVEMVYGYNGGV